MKKKIFGILPVILCLTFIACEEDNESSDPQVEAKFSTSSTTITAGESVTFTDESTGGPSSRQWTFEGGDPATSTSQTQTVTYATSGEFTATLVVSNQNNSSTETAAITVQAVPVEITAAFSQNADTISVGSVVTFTDESTGEPTSREWTFEGGDPATSSEQNPEVTYATAGSFTVTLKVTKGDAEDIETLENTVVVEEIVPLEAAFEADITTVKAGETVTFTDMSSGNPDAWLWEFEEGDPATSTEQNPQITYPTAGVFSVKLVVIQGELQDSVTQELYITVQSDISANALCLPSKITEHGEDESKVEVVLDYDDDKLVSITYRYFDNDGTYEGENIHVFTYNEEGYMATLQNDNIDPCYTNTFNYDEEGYLISEVRSTREDCNDQQWETIRYGDYNQYNYPNTINIIDNGDDGTSNDLQYTDRFQYQNLTELENVYREFSNTLVPEISLYDYDEQKNVFSGFTDLQLWGKGKVNPLFDMLADHRVAIEHNVTTWLKSTQSGERVYYATYLSYNEAGYPLEMITERSENSSPAAERFPVNHYTIEYKCE